MDIILRDDVDGLGNKGDTVTVADGYARNFLLPKGLALVAAPGAVAQADAMKRGRDARDAADRARAEEIAKVLVPQVISVSARAGSEGKLFGSVTTADIATAVETQTGIELDRRDISTEEPIRELGQHTATVKLHNEVSFVLTVDVATG